jgi:DNA-directed RNA polymerase specialized sigma24 family protein
MVPAESFLVAQLKEIGAVARRQTHRVAAAVYHSNGEAVDKAEFITYSETAAYLAFIELGGQPECPESFEWQGRRTELLRATQRELRKILKGADQGFDDARLRSRHRPDRASVQEFQWSSWARLPHTKGIDRIHHGRRSIEDDTGREYVAVAPSCDTSTISHELDVALQQLSAVMAEELSESELALLTEHYFEGRSQCELARELAATSPLYAGKPDGEARAYNAVMVKTHRARRKLKTILGEPWRQLQGELGEVA